MPCDKKKKAISDKRWRDSNKEAIAVYARNWRLTNKDKMAAFARKWRADNKEKKAAYNREYYKLNQEHLRSETKKRFNPEKHKVYYENNKAKIGVYVRDYMRESLRRMSSAYIRRLIVSNSQILKSADIPQELVDMKRESLRLKRTIKEVTNG